MNAGMPTRLAIVTVLYRSSEILAETLPTWVNSAGDLPIDFVFADNSPEDNSENVLAECLGQRKYLYLADPGNPGFAAGCNRAIAALGGNTHVLLLNPDVWLDGDSLSIIWKSILADPQTPLAIVLQVSGRFCAGISMHPVSLFIDRPVGAQRAPLGPSGGAAVFPVELYRRFGGLYEDMFAWGEDADLAFRLYASGVRATAVNLELRHKGGHSVDGNFALLRFRSFLLTRNRILVAARVFSWPLTLCVIPAMAVAHVALGARRAGQGLLWSFLRGVGRGLLGAPAARREWHGKRFGFKTLMHYLRDRGK